MRERCGVVSAVVAVSATGDRSPSPGLAPCCSPPLNLGHHPPLELDTEVHEVFAITEKAPTKTFCTY